MLTLMRLFGLFKFYVFFFYFCKKCLIFFILYIYIYIYIFLVDPYINKMKVIGTLFISRNNYLEYFLLNHQYGDLAKIMYTQFKVGMNIYFIENILSYNYEYYDIY